MAAPKIVSTLIVLSCCAAVAAQTTPPKQKPPQKPPVTAKPVPKTPAPAKAAAPLPPPPPTDIQYRTRYITGAQVSENRTYIQGARQRFEFPGLTMITQCDLHRSLQINDSTKHYLVVSTDPPAPAVAPSSAASQEVAGAPRKAGGIITETTTLTDTGERKQMFGLEARHIRTVVVRQPGEHACEKKTTSIETDGWYADLPEHATCAIYPTQAPPPPAASQATCTDSVVVQQVGEAKPGFALGTVLTTTVADAKEKDKEVTTMSMEIVDLKVTTLDKSLFDVPGAYTEVKDYASLLPSIASGASLSDAVFGSIADGTSTVAPKKAGVVRIGVGDPANTSGQDLPDLRHAAVLMASFNKLPFEGVPLSGTTPADLDRDGASKACDYVLISDISEIRATRPGKVGGFLKKVSGDPNTSSEVQHVKIDYKLYAVGDQTKPRMTASVQASSGSSFGVGSVLRIAAFAGQMYLSIGMNAGMMLGLTGPGGSSLGGLGGLSGGMLSGRTNPGLGAMMSIMSGAGNAALTGGMPGASDPTGEKVMETLQDGLAQVGKQVSDELKKRLAQAAAKK